MLKLIQNQKPFRIFCKPLLHSGPQEPDPEQKCLVDAGSETINKIRIRSPTPAVFRIQIRKFRASHIRILRSSSKNNKKTLDFSCLVTSFGFLFVKSDVNIPSTGNEQKN